MSVRIYRPDGEIGQPATTLATAPATLGGLRIGVLDNGKPNAALVMTRLAETLAKRVDATVSLVTKKGPQGQLRERGDPVRARHLRARRPRERRRDHRHRRLRELHRVQRLRRHRAREGREARDRRDDDAVRDDRRDDERALRARRTRVVSCSPTRSAAPTRARSRRGPTTPSTTALALCTRRAAA